MPTTADGTWFGIFPAQANYDTTPDQQRAALHALTPWANTTDSLRGIAEALGIIEPPTPEAEDERPAPTCDAGHDRDRHEVTRTDGTTHCEICTYGSAGEREVRDPAGATRRIRHLLINGHSLRTLAAMIGVSHATVAGFAHGRRRTVTTDLHARIAEVFDQHRDDYHEQPYHAAAAQARRDWVWAELYEDIDDPNCQPVIPKAVAA